MTVTIALLLGLVAGASGAWLLLRSQLGPLEHELRLREEALATARTELAEARATLDLERAAAAEKLELVERAEEKLADTFKALSAEALHSSQRSFLELAKSAFEGIQIQARGDLEQRRQAVEALVKPLQDSLARVDGKIEQLELARRQSYGALSEQLRSLADTHERLRAETGNLVNALRQPAARGRWGEIQLRRVVEMAGMLAHCDFFEQATATMDDGARLRPDLIVRLPGGKNVVVDAKAPLQAYLDALDTTDEDARAAFLADHARQIRQHLQRLSLKGYWEQFRPTPEFVVMFIPGEAFYSAALQQDPGLIEDGVGHRVLIATPTTLIAVLKAVAYGWQQETVAESARAVSELGRELYTRIGVLGEHVVNLGRRLDGAVKAYNDTVGSLERRVLPQARRFADLGAGGPKEIPSPEPVERTSQEPQALELVRGDSEDPETRDLPERAVPSEAEGNEGAGEPPPPLASGEDGEVRDAA
jgi:DNA recombination protein RmuC